jgi:hypothetical protein
MLVILNRQYHPESLIDYLTLIMPLLQSPRAWQIRGSVNLILNIYLCDSKESWSKLGHYWSYYVNNELQQPR